MATDPTPHRPEPDAPRRPRIGLVLTGGGARAAYQAGVLRAVARLLPRGAAIPFSIVCGTSAGAFNAAAIAASAGSFRRGTAVLVDVWRSIHAADVYRSDVAGIARSGAWWLVALMLGGLGRRNPASLLDNAPLGRLIERRVDFPGIARGLATGTLAALSITASGYSSGQSISFFQSADAREGWQRARRSGVPAAIDVRHLMASAAMPFIFPAVRIGDDYYGDGSMRQIAPLAPALHLGAQRLLVISVGRIGVNRESERDRDGYPSLAQIAGHALTSIYFDALEADLEQLERINRAARQSPVPLQGATGEVLRDVEYLLLTPSERLEDIAAAHLTALPRPVRFFLRGVGALRRSGSSLASYLLFEAAFTRTLLRLGYADAMARRDELAALFREA